MEGVKHKKLKTKLRKIAESLGIRVSFRKIAKYDHTGEADTKESMVWVNPTYNRRNIISAFFHEVGHVLDHRNKVYLKYYYKYPFKSYLRRFGLRAEIHADNLGATLCKQYFPSIRYVRSYRNAIDRKYFKDYWEIG